MTRSEGRAWKKRWALANARDVEELRRTPPETKLRQLAALMASIDAMGWRESLEAEAEQVRARWRLLRKAYEKEK
jgi:hypothetical protein